MPNHQPSNRRGANPAAANVRATSVPVIGALVPSRSNPGEQHLVCWSTAGGHASCTCEGWRAKGTCYHVTTVIAQLMSISCCPVCGATVSDVLDGDRRVACCDRCEWAIIN